MAGMIVVGHFFLGEGALALGYTALRALCVRRVTIAATPRVLRRRIAVGNQLMPGLCWLGAIAVCLGLALVAVGGGFSE